MSHQTALTQPAVTGEALRIRRWQVTVGAHGLRGTRESHWRLYLWEELLHKQCKNQSLSQAAPCAINTHAAVLRSGRWEAPVLLVEFHHLQDSPWLWKAMCYLHDRVLSLHLWSFVFPFCGLPELTTWRKVSAVAKIESFKSCHSPLIQKCVFLNLTVKYTSRCYKHLRYKRWLRVSRLYAVPIMQTWFLVNPARVHFHLMICKQHL